MTALACTLPKDSGRSLSRWSSAEIARAVRERGITSSISPATVRRWLRQDKIKPWRYRLWQKPTDPYFLQKAIPILRLYQKAQTLARQGHLVVCTDEKTSIQARRLIGGLQPAGPGSPMKAGDRYERKGALQLFTALSVPTGETMACCFSRKRFREFRSFLIMLFESAWCEAISHLHLILDNGTTHAPKKLGRWVASLRLPFSVRLHWLPVHASWLDQVEIVFSEIQRKVLTPNHFETRDDLERMLLNHLEERNRRAQPIRWTYTPDQCLHRFSLHLRHAA